MIGSDCNVLVQFVPPTKTTPMVRFAVWALRAYALVLSALIGLKSARVLSGTHRLDGPARTPAAATPTNPPSAASNS